MKTLWMILAGACGVLAAFFVIVNEFEKAFVAAAAGAVCWFLNYRQKLKQKLSEEDDDDEIRS